MYLNYELYTKKIISKWECRQMRNYISYQYIAPKMMTFQIILIYLIQMFGIFVLGSQQRRFLVHPEHDTQQQQQQQLQQQQLDHLQIEIQNLQVKLQTQQNTITSQQSIIEDLQRGVAAGNTGRGVSFIRWGRSDCPGNFTSVYTGFAGGSWYDHTGAAVDYLCMPSNPIWGPNKDQMFFNNFVGYVYGSEYEGSIYTHDVTAFNKDVACTFCTSDEFSMHAMIPGRTMCYSGWTKAYHGVLSSGFFGHHAASQYVCMDQNPQALDGIRSLINDDGKLFYPVKSKCGSLRCPPYEDNKILSCVVCVK